MSVVLAVVAVAVVVAVRAVAVAVVVVVVTVGAVRCGGEWLRVVAVARACSPWVAGYEASSVTHPLTNSVWRCVRAALRV